MTTTGVGEPHATAEPHGTVSAGTFAFQAVGRPRPQGSKRHVGRGVMIEASAVRPWRDTITAAAIGALDAQGVDPMVGPVFATLQFMFARPASHYGTGRNADRLKPSAPLFPTTRNCGDADKLARCVLDACTDARVWLDDSQVVNLAVRKVWGSPVIREGVWVFVEPVLEERA